MAPGGDGSRHCEHCARDVHSSTELDASDFERLVESASERPTCARFALSGGRPRLAGGALAGLLVVALTGCGADETVAPTNPWVPAWSSPRSVALAPEQGAQLTGQVRDPETHAPVDGALVMLEGPELVEPLLTFTDEYGGFGFVNLEGGSYTLITGNDLRPVELAVDTRVVLAVDFQPVSILLGGIMAVDEDFAEPGPHLVEDELDAFGPG